MNREQMESLEIKISLFLRYGVLVAGALMLIGWLSQIDLSGEPFSKFTTYQPHEFRELVRTAPISMLGLVCLISLPIIRVFLTLILFLLERQWIMSALAGIVFAALMVSFALGVHL